MLLPLGNFIHLISWCGNFVERRSFRIASGESPETMLKLRLQNLYTRESGEITAFFRSVSRKSYVTTFMTSSLDPIFQIVSPM